jgi:hypothetical protein
MTAIPHDTAAVRHSLYYEIQSMLSPFMRSDTDLMCAMSTIWPSIEERLDVLATALEESVRMQSHYAVLLNDYEAFVHGARRLQFASADAWIARLRETGTLK